MRRIAALATFISLAAPALAAAQSPGSGGTQAPGRPLVSAVVCSDGRTSECSSGARLKIVGENLHGVDRVHFVGGPGRADDRSVRPRAAAPETLSIVVPRRTRSGPVEVHSWSGSARVAAIRITPGAVSEPAPDAPSPSVFPIAGTHQFSSTTGRFGGGRGHEGQDVSAACGTRLVAAMPGRVIKSTFHSRAGNYVVIQHADGRSTAYMHMRRSPTVATGDRVLAGDGIGEVGQTGRASGCHLHFELWTAPGWYRGGRPIDPLATLRAMESA